MDLGSGLNTISGMASSALSSVGGAISTVGKLAGALNNLSNPAALISSLRSLNLPKGGEAGVGLSNVSASFGGTDTSSDWRVRLSIPPAFASSPVLSPLVQAGALVFPYTPSIQISSAASYEDTPITHQNYQFVSYQNSRINSIQINAPFNVEDGAQALYWLAAVHMLRSATKMFTGEGDLQGNPPPILKLNGYGDYMFKNVPVVVQSFSVDLPADTNYINTSMAANIAATTGPLSSIAGIAAGSSQLAGLAGALGSNSLARSLGTIATVGGAVMGVANLASSFSNTAQSLLGGGSFGTSGNSWVPVKSSFSITLQPIYSREAARQFSLQKFVNGGYVSNGGYV